MMAEPQDGYLQIQGVFKYIKVNGLLYKLKLKHLKID